MAILEIVEYPHPILRQRARDVLPEEIDDALRTKLTDMAETMYAAPGVGLAAPQVADGRRFVVIDPGEGDERGVNLYKMINPRIVERSEREIDWFETCLSVPELEVKVRRSFAVRVEWLDERGEGRSSWFEEFPAIIIQHELDHLDGTVLADRASAFKRKRWLARRAKQNNS